jgi:hypothetical protein
MPTLDDCFQLYCRGTGAGDEQRVHFYAGAAMVIKLMRDSKIPLDTVAAEILQEARRQKSAKH